MIKRIVLALIAALAVFCMVYGGFWLESLMTVKTDLYWWAAAIGSGFAGVLTFLYVMISD